MWYKSFNNKTLASKWITLGLENIVLCFTKVCVSAGQGLVVSTLFAVLSSGASAGYAVAWPGARVVSAQPTVFAAKPTVVPAQTKIYGFSTTQYINSVSLKLILLT